MDVEWLWCVKEGSFLVKKREREKRTITVSNVDNGGGYACVGW